MNKINKISSIKTELESVAPDKAKGIIWKSDYKFSERYNLSRIFEDTGIGITKKINQLCDDYVNMLYSIFVEGKKKAMFFESKHDVAEFLFNIVGDIDTTKINNDIIEGVNNIYESIKKEHPDYDPNDKTTWGGNMEIDQLYHPLYMNMVHENKMAVTKKHMQLCMIKKKLYESTIPVENGKRDLYKMVYEVLDESSIVLLYSYIFGDFVQYTDEIRDKVWDYIEKNPNSSAVNIITTSPTDAELDMLKRSFNYYDVQDFMMSKSFMAFRKNTHGKICSIKYAGDNKFEIKEL